MGKLFVGGPNREKKYTISGIKLAIKMAKTLLKKKSKDNPRATRIGRTFILMRKQLASLICQINCSSVVYFL